MNLVPLYTIEATIVGACLAGNVAISYQNFKGRYRWNRPDVTVQALFAVSHMSTWAALVCSAVSP